VRHTTQYCLCNELQSSPTRVLENNQCPTRLFILIHYLIKVTETLLAHFDVPWGGDKIILSFTSPGDMTRWLLLHNPQIMQLLYSKRSLDFTWTILALF